MSDSQASSSTNPLPRHDVFQSDEKFTLSIFVKGLKPEDVSVSFRERSMKLTLPNSSPYDISPFPHPIDTEKSTYRVSAVKVEIVLVKKDLGIKWSGLIGEGDHDGGFPAPHSKEETTPAVARQKKDWSKLADEAIKNPAEGETAPAGGDEAVNDLFKNIYANADEDSRRAMMKSMQESGGTTLSTNWADIGKKKTEIQAPSGMVAKKYEM